jgi:hypothetical protein
MVSYFGSPCKNDSLRLVELPIIGKAYVHKLTAPAFAKVFAWIRDAGLAALVDRDAYGGTYCCRNVRGSSAKSPHSWAVAMDLNTDHIMRGGKEVRGTSNFRCSPEQVPDTLKRLEPFFTAWGFTWGGFWSSYLDPMHFEATEYTLALTAGNDLPAAVQAVVDAAREKIVVHAVDPAPHDPPLLIGPDQTVVAEGRMVDGTLWTPTRATVEASGAELAWHPEQGKGYIVTGKDGAA